MEFGVRFWTIFKCLGGAAGSSFGDIFRFFEARFSRAISDAFLEGFFTLPGRFWTPSGIVFESFRWLLALAETVPCLHGSYVFDVLSGQKQGFFRHRFRRGSWRRFLLLFGVFWAPLGTRRLHFGHHGALSSRTDFEEIFGAKMMDFWTPWRTREIVPAVADGLAREEKIYFGHDSWYHAA